MYKRHPAINTPPDDTVIWRYMDFTKFIDLLDRQTLWFSRADKLSDPFEGISTVAALQKFARMAQQYMPTYEAIGGDNLIAFREFFRRATFFVSCWNMKEEESFPMWRTYVGSAEGVAIKSSIGSLKAALEVEAEHDVYVENVEYIDHGKHVDDTDNPFAPILHKRKLFEDERELRAFAELLPNKSIITLQDLVDFRAGIPISVDLDALVEEIYVSPTSPCWFVELVRFLVHKHCLDKSVIRSHLDDTPI